MKAFAIRDLIRDTNETAYPELMTGLLTTQTNHNRNCLGRRKMENWRELLKDKPVKYWIRAEIEEIIKEKSIDRKRFYEYSKTNYQKIINRFYYTFVDYKKYPKVELSYCWLHFRQELKEIDCVSETIGWEGMLAKIKERLSYDWNKRFI